MEKVKLARRVQQLEKQVGKKYSLDNILGASKVIKEAIQLAKKVAATDTTVLLLGETGTGKEVFAQSLHQASRRNDHAFVAVNCSAFTRELLESELFGYKAGAFTGALKDKKGLFEEANGGTIFLDEIGEMAIGLQAKLLRVLETGEFIKIGDTKTIKVNVRIIAATIITVILTICIIIGFTFLFNFPSLIASPVASLTEGIKAIANKNYSQRIHLNRKDEFGELANAFNSMAEKLDDYEHSNLSKILFEKQRAETVINSLKDASIGIDNKDVVLFANQQALQLLSLKEQDIVGVQKEEVKKRNDLFRFLIDESNNTPFKIVVEGKENYFTKEMIELKNNDQKTGSVIVLKNITPFKELDVAKTNFIATVSHELKTPLASSDFSLTLLEDERVGTLTNEQKELAKSLKEDNKRLLRILSELLDMSQMESGKIQLNLQAVTPSVMIEKAISSVQNVAAAKNISLRKELPANLTPVKADADKTTWVLNNFLTNALRYSPENAEVILSVRQHATTTEFSVKDFGKGIDPQYTQRIFDRYFRIPGTPEHGTGLGLAICREFIEAQSGKIWLESNLGAGSEFCFELPLA